MNVLSGYLPVPRRLLRHAGRKLQSGLILSLLIPLPYFALQYLPRPVHQLTPSAFDVLPFLPQSMWIYQSLYVLLFGAGLFHGTLKSLKHFVRAMLAASVAAFLVFLVWPTSVPRPLESGGLYGLWTMIEKPSNAFPSLHAAFCTLLALSIRSYAQSRIMRLLVGIWIAGILLSTLTTRQHVLFDLAGGILLGAAAFFASRSRAPRLHTVLLITGSSLDPSGSVPGALIRMIAQLRLEKHKFLSLKVKAVIAEALFYSRLTSLSAFPGFLKQYLRKQPEPPSLTHVLLEELLRKEGFRVLHLSVSEVHDRPLLRRRTLREARTVLVSTTLLHDLSELLPLARLLKRSFNRVVAGGAMTGSLPADWPGDDSIDVVCPGYGETIVPLLAQWIRSNFERMPATDSARLKGRQRSQFLETALPSGTSLDSLQTAEWKRAVRRSPTRMIYYESVRGCPYRCGFCNYPFLFADSRFRYRSARAMFEDWKRYAELDGVEIINCLDSLFTMPKKRLHEFCGLLAANPLPLRWICYARADDLDLETALMMKATGAMQVHIGIESGDPVILSNMNKQATVEANAAALESCRKAEITSIATLVVGYPGETAKTLDNTLSFLKQNPPDFHFLAAFSTRVAGVPVLTPESRKRFGLRTDRNLYTMSPYWTHDTMNCAEAGVHLRRLTRTLIEDRISLDAAVFYGGILDYEPAHRSALLDFQEQAFKRSRGKRLFDSLHAWLDRRLTRDLHLLDGGAYPEN